MNDRNRKMMIDGILSQMGYVEDLYKKYIIKK